MECLAKLGILISVKKEKNYLTIKIMEKAEEKLMEAVGHQIELAERVNSTVAVANSFREECGRIGMLVNRLSPRLKELYNMIRIFSASTQPLYDRPIVAVVAEVSRNLRRSLILVRKCKHWGLFRWFSISNRTTEFRIVFSLLEFSIGDLEWLLCIFGRDDGDRAITLPSIAIYDPDLPWVWYFIAALKIGKLRDRIDAANDLASLAKGNARNKRIIEEEGGIPPLLKLLGDRSPESQIAAVNALWILSDNQDIARSVVKEKRIPSIVKLLRTSPIKVQITAVKLVVRIAEHNAEAQKEFAEAHVTGPLLKLLSFDVIQDENTAYVCKNQQKITNSENDSVSCKFSNVYLNWYFEGRERAKIAQQEWEKEKPEVKHELKMNCSEALLILARGNGLISKSIIERNGLISLVKLIEKEQGELRNNCLMIVGEITAIADLDRDFRQSAIKNSSPSVKALIDQLLRVIEESEDERLQIPAIRSIGSLARIFPAKEIRVIESLVCGSSGKRRDVAEEAIKALRKFVCPENHLRSAHANSIIAFEGVAALTRLIEKASKEAKVLLSEVESAAGIGSEKRDEGESTAEKIEPKRLKERRQLKRPSYRL